MTATSKTAFFKKKLFSSKFGKFSKNNVRPLNKYRSLCKCQK